MKQIGRVGLARCRGLIWVLEDAEVLGGTAGDMDQGRQWARGGSGLRTPLWVKPPPCRRSCCCRPG